MSYNESVRSNSNYPLMSQSQWDSSPTAEEVIPDRDFDVLCSQTLSKSVRVKTNNYYPEYDDEDGHTHANTENTVWSEEFHDNDYHTPLQLIGLLKQVLETDLKLGMVFKSPGYTDRLIKECEGWQEDDVEYIEE